MNMTIPPEVLDAMVSRFLCWKLPEDFAPDAGISFTPTHFQQGERADLHWPVGTNLFTATQARAMLEAVLAAAAWPALVPWAPEVEPLLAAERQRCAAACEAIAAERFFEHGSREDDTNACYYKGNQAEFYEAMDEENEACAKACRALTPYFAPAGLSQQA